MCWNRFASRREGKHVGPRAGLAPRFLQASMPVLRIEYADEYKLVTDDSGRTTHRRAL